MFILFFSMTASAESFKIAGQLEEFTSRDGVLVSGCGKTCQALEELKKHKKISIKSLRKAKSFAGSTGSEVCFTSYKGRAVLGIAENRDQRAFCYFNDGSMIEINSLSQYLEANKIIK